MVKEYGGDSSRIYKDKSLGGSDNDFATSITEAVDRQYWFGGYSLLGFPATKQKLPAERAIIG